MERRDLFRVLAATAAAPLAGAEPYKPRFFTPEQYEALDRLCEKIIPADDDGGGAHEAGVAAYIDTVILHADAKAQAEWKRDFNTVPLDDNDPFFVRLKILVIQAFFHSETGLNYVGYKGHSGGLSFTGCNHKEHH